MIEKKKERKKELEIWDFSYGRYLSFELAAGARGGEVSLFSFFFLWKKGIT